MLKNPLSQRERAIAEIDARIHDIELRFLATDGNIPTSEVLGYFRAVYTQGYIDCLREAEGQRGKWIRDLGYGVTGVDI